MDTSPSDKKNIVSNSIHVVVADDSLFICRLLTQYLESEPTIKVIKTVQNGKAAMDAIRKHKPDVLTLDLTMPVLNGLEALKRIMAECPTAVLLISGISKQAARMTKAGLSLGAVDFILKYSPGKTISPDTLRREIIAKVKAAARVKLIRSIPTIGSRLEIHKRAIFPSAARSRYAVYRGISRLVVIGASTGGPLALKDLLSSLKEDFSFSIVIVQHMPKGFTAILAEQFDRLFSFPVSEARNREYLSSGTVLVAPADRHLLINSNGIVRITMTAEVNGHRPSIDVAMQSAAQTFGSDTAGVLLSGMGIDGIQGLTAIKHNCGATFAQSKETCVIDTMPYGAIKQGIVERVGSPAEIGGWLTEGCGITVN